MFQLKNKKIKIINFVKVKIKISQRKTHWTFNRVFNIKLSTC